MGGLVVGGLRVVLAVAFAGSVFVQAVMAPLLARDLEALRPEYAYLRVPLLAFFVLGVVCLQVCVVCVWRLVGLVRRGTVFSSAAFLYVDVIIGAIVAAAVLTFGLGVALAPGEAVAPGVVLLIGGAGVVASGVALIVVVLRMLAQAVARDAEAVRLQSELDEVI